MVKGVNRSVIEIRNTDDGYIEGAILFINPDKAGEIGPRIKAKADAFLRRTDARIGAMTVSGHSHAIRMVLVIVSAFLSGAGLMYGIMCWI